MPLISACIGSIEFALASIAKWPTSCTRAIQALSASRLRMVWYLLRSTGSFRAASSRAAASEIGVPLRLAVLSFRLSPDLFGSFPAALVGAGEKRSPLPADAAAEELALATAPPPLFP